MEFCPGQNKVFWGINVAKANPQTFRHITCRFGEDGRKVFYYNRIVPEAEPASFEFIGGEFWAKDRHRVYCHDSTVPGADPASAKVVGSFLNAILQVEMRTLTNPFLQRTRESRFSFQFGCQRSRAADNRR